MRSSTAGRSSCPRMSSTTRMALRNFSKAVKLPSKRSTTVLSLACKSTHCLRLRSFSLRLSRISAWARATALARILMERRSSDRAFLNR